MPIEDLKMESSSSTTNKPITEKLISRILSNMGSSRYESSFRVYYPAADTAISVPFTWESQPGTPKHHSLDQYSNSNIPPLTPPPSYYSNNKSSPLLHSNKVKKKSIFFSVGGGSSKLKILLFSLLAVRKRSSIAGGSSSYYSSSSSSSSSGSSSTSLSVSSDSPSNKSKSPALIGCGRHRWPARSSSSYYSSSKSTKSKFPLHRHPSINIAAVEEDDDGLATAVGTSRSYLMCFRRSRSYRSN